MGINIDELTVGEIKQIAKMAGCSSVQNDIPLTIGESYFFRTVTYHYVGRAVKVEGDFIFLEDAAWVADSGRFYNALKDCEFKEIEPYPNGTRVNIKSVVDFCKWHGDLPLEQK